jgi:hypothetical protein
MGAYGFLWISMKLEAEFFFPKGRYAALRHKSSHIYFTAAKRRI